VVTATRRLSGARQSLAEAEQFLDITRKQESGGEVAHADVVKAELQAEQRRRELQDAGPIGRRRGLAWVFCCSPTLSRLSIWWTTSTIWFRLLRSRSFVR